MVKLVASGEYRILKTPSRSKLIVLGHREFGWTKIAGDGERLVKISQLKNRAKIVDRGRFRIYKVHNEQSLIDDLHLELLGTKRNWRAYLLSRGLPTARSRQTPIKATVEIISSPRG